MAPRPAWSGYLKLSLVTCAVQLTTVVTQAEKVSFHILNRRTGNRVRRLYVDAKSGKPLDDDDEVRGYEVGKDEFIFIEEEDIEAVQIESSHTLDLDGFADKSSIEKIYLYTPYYLTPADKVSREAFVVIRDALTEKQSWPCPHRALSKGAPGSCRAAQMTSLPKSKVACRMARWSISPNTSSTSRKASSIQLSSGTDTKKHCWNWFAPRRPAGRRRKPNCNPNIKRGQSFRCVEEEPQRGSRRGTQVTEVQSGAETKKDQGSRVPQQVGIGAVSVVS